MKIERRTLVISAALWAAGLARGAEAPKGPTPLEVRVELGTKANALRFVPDRLSFERGVYYRLVIHNPSPQAHYFNAEALATHAFTRKVEVLGATGEALAELHGTIHDLEVAPGATVAWYFYPMTNGQDLPLLCHKEGHREGGMVGSLSISGPPPFSSPSSR